LRADEHCARIRGRESLERLAAALGQRLEEGLGVVLDPGLPAASAAPAASERREVVKILRMRFISVPSK
jgi:hypothetical protein